MQRFQLIYGLEFVELLNILVELTDKKQDVIPIDKSLHTDEILEIVLFKNPAAQRK